MSRRPPCHLDADTLRQALGADELVLVYRVGDQLGYVAAGVDARRAMDARRAGDVALVAVCRDRGIDPAGMLGHEHGDAAAGDAPAAPAVPGEGEGDVG